jgi:precorrin-6B C5,15-methyltransferase / cobalt-precorrin-6B C5,C15-methyltransferase
VADRRPEHGKTLAIVGAHGAECYGSRAQAALADADVVMGASRHLDSIAAAGPLKRESPPVMLPLGSDLPEALEKAIALLDRGLSVCMVVSGDPGFFGIARLAGARIGRERVSVHPAPSSVSLAFAAFAERWDDAVVASAHGRDPEAACQLVSRHPKVAVLTSPQTPPEDLGRRLMDMEIPARLVRVASRMGEAEESTWEGSLAGLAAGSFDPISVVVFQSPGAIDQSPSLRWGLGVDEFEHRNGMITKAEVRAVALGKLGLPPSGVLWDVGSGSGSVAAECSRLAPGLAVYAVERSAPELERMRHNLAFTGARVVAGEAPSVLSTLPDPDRAFVGGGGLDVLDEVIRRLRPGGRVVATFAAMDRAAEAGKRLGSVVQVSVSRGVPLGPDAALRLDADNPVFVCWGPQ